MSPAGRKPNEGAPVRHKVRPVHQWFDVPDVPFEGDVPALPKTQPGQPSWPTATKHWWESISRMPHCILWHDSDWQFALDTALVAAAFHRGDEKSAATELRRREKVMGTTLEARRNLRIRYVEVQDESQAGVTAIEEYRERLRG